MDTVIKYSDYNKIIGNATVIQNALYGISRPSLDILHVSYSYCEVLALNSPLDQFVLLLEGVLTWHSAFGASGSNPEMSKVFKTTSAFTCRLLSSTMVPPYNRTQFRPSHTIPSLQQTTSGRPAQRINTNLLATPPINLATQRG